MKSPSLSRRELLKAACLGTAGLAMPGGLAHSQGLGGEQSASRPNIILIMADDMGFSDLGCYGSEIHTPNLDRLAGGGLRFTQFYNNAKCTPSRSSLLTGLYNQPEGEEVMENSVNIAQVLKSVGYSTLMTGKDSGGITGLPTEQGFDRYYGLISGCCNYFNPGLRRPGEKEPGRKSPGEQRPWVIDGKVVRPYTPEDPDFYTTDAFSDAAVEYLDEFGQKDDPFFLYLPYTAPHFPLHAWPEDIAKYRGKYKVGWDAIRKRRHERLVELGIIDEQWDMSERDADVLAWEDVEDKDSPDLEMAVYAAMIDRMDQGIGKVMAKVEELGIEENTLILFLSDNGSCAEDYRAFKSTAKEIPPGPMESYRTLGVSWANASNTPFRKFKWWNHEGGMATPLIAYWPKVIKNGGQITHQVGHIMDVMATCSDIAGADYPESYKGQEILPLEGKSLLPVFQGKQRVGHEVLYWRHLGSSAVRQGKWKLVAPHPNPRMGIDYFSQEGKGPRSPDAKRWELYDMEIDRMELNDLADEFPRKVEEMAGLYEVWLARG